MDKAKDTFFSHIEVTDGCWLWRGFTNKQGYGVTYYMSNKYLKNGKKTKNKLAYQASYKLFIGDVQKGMVLDHLCEVKLCVNPFHLEEVTISENVIRHHQNNILENACVRGHSIEYRRGYNTPRGYQRYCAKCNSTRRKEKILTLEL